MKLMGEAAEAVDKKPPNSNKSVVPTTAVPVSIYDSRCIVLSPLANLAVPTHFHVHLDATGKLLVHAALKNIGFTFSGAPQAHRRPCPAAGPSSGNREGEPRIRATLTRC